jgi:replicative DNA helicase
VSEKFEDLKKEIDEENTLSIKEQALRKNKIQNQFEQMERNQSDLEFYKNIDLSKKDNTLIAKWQKENEDYILAARSKMPFICNEFMDIVPFFAKNLILIGAKTGEGKSTTAANIIYSTILHNKRVLVLTNEESAPDIYNRITCLIKEWVYTNHDKFSDEQILMFNAYMERLSDFITVVDDSYSGRPGTTTTLEGITSVLESLIEKGTQFDAIVIDYIQLVSTSKNNNKLEKWQVLQKLVEYLASFRNRYLAPVVLLAQLHNTSNKEASFEERCKGFKGMMEPMTCVMEVRPDKANYRSEWVIHKSRWAMINRASSFFTGWLKGRYVAENNPKFLEWVADKRYSKTMNSIEEVIDAKPTK